MFLVSSNAFSCGKMHFRLTIITVHQSRKQTCSACCCRSAAVLTKLLYSQPLFFGDYRLLHIRNNLMFFRWLVDGFMHLVADGRGLEIHSTARVLPVFKDMHNHCLIPTVRISRHFLCVISAYTFVIGRRDKDLFFLNCFAICDGPRPARHKA